MTALYRREKTGRGARVTASLIAEGAWGAGCWLSAVLAGASNPRPVDRPNPPNALGNIYRTADDRWLLLAFANENKEVPLFLKAIGHPEAAEDPRFTDSASRHAHAAEIVALLDKTFATRPLAEWREVLDGAGLTYGVVQTLEEAAHDPQFFADRVFVPVDDGGTEPLPDHRQPRAAGPGAEGSPAPSPRPRRTHPGRAGRARLRHRRDQGAGRVPGRFDFEETHEHDPQATGRGVDLRRTRTVQTRELDGILVITINRPKVRNAVDGATARALAEAFDQLDARDDPRGRRAHRRRRHVQRRHGPQGLRGGRHARHPRPGIRRPDPGSPADPAHRRRRGLGTGWWHRDGTGLRPDRRRAGRHVRPVRGHPRPGPSRGGHRAPARTHPPQHRDGTAAHR